MTPCKCGGDPQTIKTRKRKSLAGTMAPLTEAQNRDMFARNGFSVCECFWRSVNFAAFLLMR